MTRRVAPRCRTVPGPRGRRLRWGGCSPARGSAAGGALPAPGSQRGALHRRDGRARGGAAGSGMERSGPGVAGRGGTLSACGRQLRPAGSGRGLTHTRLCVAGRSGPARSPGAGGSRGEDTGRPGVQCRPRPRGDGRAAGGNRRTAASLGRDPPPRGPDPRPEGSVGRGGQEAKAGRSRARGLRAERRVGPGLLPVGVCRSAPLAARKLWTPALPLRAAEGRGLRPGLAESPRRPTRVRGVGRGGGGRAP